MVSLQSSERTDIFSVGVLANKMLTGVLPSESRPVGPFQSIISKCLSIDPQDRYQTVSVLRTAIEKTGQSSRALPGFRKKIASQYGTFCYLVSFYLLFFPLLCRSAMKKGIPLAGFYPLYLNRAAIVSFLFLWTLYFANYQNFRDKFPFKRKDPLFLNLLRIAAGAFLLLAIPACIVAIIESVSLNARSLF